MIELALRGLDLDHNRMWLMSTARVEVLCPHLLSNWPAVPQGPHFVCLRSRSSVPAISLDRILNQINYFCADLYATSPLFLGLLIAPHNREIGVEGR
jgi:hypothetical protein